MQQQPGRASRPTPEPVRRPDDAGLEQRWRGRPGLAALLRASVIGVPVLMSVLAVLAVSHALPRWESFGGRWTYALLLVAIGLVTSLLCERVARRALPLAALLQLTMLFPDRAPSRFKLARQTNSAQWLKDRLENPRGDESSAAESILGLLTALTAHDRHTRGHAERTRVYADLLADQLRLSQADKDRLRWAALLHDIGKLKVSATILNKPGKPTPEEWASLQAHPGEGALLAAPLLSWLGEWGSAIAEHHERWDGTGYPRKLAGTEISRAGRIVGVVDAFETMTASRSYKKPISTRAAREELARCAGTQFDPAMVRAFLAISLPRLVWASGPLAFLFQIPLISTLREAGSKAMTATGQAGSAVAAAGAAGAAVVGLASSGLVPTGPAPDGELRPRPVLAAPAPSAPSAPPGVAQERRRTDPAPAATRRNPTTRLGITAPVPTGSPEEDADAGVTATTRAPTPAPPRTLPAVVVRSAPPPNGNSSESTFTFATVSPVPGYSCRLNSGPWLTCSSPLRLSLPDGAHTLGIKATDGDLSGPVLVRTWTVDTRGPVATVTSGPTVATSDTDATFTFRADEPGRAVCSLDGAVPTPCASPVTFRSLADGEHTLRVTATDTLDNAGPTALTTWLVDTVAPAVTILAGPSGTESESTATVAFAGTEVDLAFACALDGGQAEPCSSPVSWTALAEGEHSVEIWATDAASNRGPAVGRSWVVNTPAAAVTIDTGPSGPVDSSSATFTFSADQPGVMFTCSLDGDGDGAGNQTACASPLVLTGLEDGGHTLAVTGKNGFGLSSTATRSWTVDTVDPVTTISSGPTGTVDSSTATFAFTSDSTGVSFECKLDDQPVAPCSSPVTYSALGEGPHTVSVRATDAAGNEGVAAVRSWTVNALPDTTIESGPADPDTSTTATWTFSADLPGSTFECKLDGGPYQPCASPVTYSGLTSGRHRFQVQAVSPSGVDGPSSNWTWTVAPPSLPPPTVVIDSGPSGTVPADSATFGFSSSTDDATFLCSLDAADPAACTSPVAYGGLAPGDHVFSVTAMSQTAVSSAPATRSWTVSPEPSAPVTTIESGPSGTTSEDSATFTFTADQPAKFECDLDDDGTSFSGCASPETYVGLADGPHTLTVRALTEAGETGPPVSRTWTVDTSADQIVIVSGPSGTVASDSATFSFTHRNNGFDCRLDGAAFAPCTSPVSYTGLADGTRTFEVRKDSSGTGSAASVSRTWTVDTTGPAGLRFLSGPAALSLGSDATFTFDADATATDFRCSLDAAPFSACTSPTTVPAPGLGFHDLRVYAVDAWGNVSGTVSWEWTVL